MIELAATCLIPNLSEHNPMRFNPVYLVLALLSMVYAAPIDVSNQYLYSHPIQLTSLKRSWAVI